MADSAGAALMARAACALSGRWLSVRRLADILYGDTGSDRKSVMNRMVRARRPVNRMLKMGVLGVRMVGHVREFALLQCGRILLCSRQGT